MPNKTYDIDQCTSSLKSEVTILTVVAVVLLMLFATVLVFSIRQIKNDKSKKTTICSNHCCFNNIHFFISFFRSPNSILF